SDYNTDVSKSLLLRDNDTVSLEFVTSERISTEVDLLGIWKPEVFFISGTTQLPADNISLQSTDANGRNWIARLKIDESEPSLSEKEVYLGFNVKVQDKSGNERIIEFRDDETSLTQILPETPVTQTMNTSGDRARVDTKHPEVTTVALTSSNSGANTEEFPDTRLVRDGDTLTLSFETSERISLESDFGGIHKPQVSFYSGEDEFVVSDENITLRDSDGDTGRKWQAKLLIDSSLAALSEKEGFLGFEVTVLDKAGNQRMIRFVDDETSLTQQTLDGEGDFITSIDTYRARIDTKAPILSGLSLASTNTGITDTDRSYVLLATTEDTLTLFFETSERIGTPEDGALAPEIEIHDNDSNKIGIGRVSVQSTDAGTERLWKAEFTVPDEEAFSNYEMDLGFQISVKDPSGNPRVIGFDELGTLIDETGTQTTQAPSNGARIDTKSP
ncbi:MAG: hypothetical protein VX020_00685, partial [SAR324 cluster bacterium]|nr:hypothetical protein [SAR324 cluster bacterium]